MRNIQYYFSRGIEYGKVPASSYREDGKVKKRDDGIYLGRVIGDFCKYFISIRYARFLPYPCVLIRVCFYFGSVDVCMLQLNTVCFEYHLIQFPKDILYVRCQFLLYKLTELHE